jgi:hypothetical protein
MNKDSRSRMQLLAHMLSLDSDLKGRDPKVLEQIWGFDYDSDKSPEHNVYEFFDQLEQWRGYCRRWHINNGGDQRLMETLDTVREQNILPKITEFLDKLKQHL